MAKQNISVANIYSADTDAISGHHDIIMPCTDQHILCVAHTMHSGCHEIQEYFMSYTCMRSMRVRMHNMSCAHDAYLYT